ncbi:MAG: hypothetical protein QNK37_10840 [Acidobacteriota bacterium]|nr:hypothetical protein [Acidobacteriota bacterium]
MKSLLFFFIMVALVGPLWAAELTSSTTTITAGQKKQPAGALILTIDDDDFRTVDPTNPAYIQFCLPEGVKLDQTLVGPLDNPINLGARLNAPGTALELALASDAVQLVRFVDGERCFYLKVNQNTNLWLRPVGGSPTDPTRAPNLDATVSFGIGFSDVIGSAYGFENTDAGTGFPVSTPIVLDVSRFWVLTKVRLVFTSYMEGINLDPLTATTPWPAPVFLSQDLLPVTVDNCPAIARTTWFGGAPFPFKK